MGFCRFFALCGKSCFCGNSRGDFHVFTILLRNMRNNKRDERQKSFIPLRVFMPTAEAVAARQLVLRSVFVTL